jgi:hypothetical protein
MLANVFIQCLPATTYVKPSICDAPLLVSSVCHAWRNIAIATPALWSSLELDDDVRIRDRPFIETWISRSGILPLSLSFMTGYGTSEGVNVLLRHSKRWKRLRLIIPQDGSHFFTSFSPHLPSLETIEVETLASGTSSHVERIADLFRSAPRLCHLSWNMATYPTTIPYSQLTCLHLKRGCAVTVLNCLEIMELSSNLAECEFHDVTTLPRQFNPHAPFQDVRRLPARFSSRAPISLARLTKLYIQGTPDLGVFFEAIELPALCMFGLRMSPLLDRNNMPIFLRPWPRRQFMDLLVRSNCSLSSLLISSVDISERQLLDFLRSPQASSLINLDIVNCGVLSDEIMRSLTCPCMQTPHPPSTTVTTPLCLCPKLKSIKLACNADYSSGTVANMVESRWKVRPTTGENLHCARASLASVGLLYSPRAEDIRRLSYLQREGLAVYYVSAPNVGK